MLRPRWVFLAAWCCLGVGIPFLPPLPAWSVESAVPGRSHPSEAAILTHDLSIELAPADHRLSASDWVTLRISAPELRQLTFSLHAALRVKAIRAVTTRGSHPLSFTSQAAGQGDADPGAGSGPQAITVELETPLGRNQVLTLEWLYEGIVNDPPRSGRQLRFVAPSETTGHVGPEGVYLSGETHWYPNLPGSLATFRLRVTTPDQWESVSHGRLVSRTAQDQSVTAIWRVTDRTVALTLVANRFVRTHRDWRDNLGRAIEVAAYLLPENQHLAGEYIEASIQYLETYSKLLGPYPFPKFAVVENFFPSGLGMPSFTLLGSGVVKRHYVQPFALGHEIVHSWIGNDVLNDAEQGNWVEGLTTYLANYYYDELTGKTKEAREQRRMMLLGYAVYVRPDEDYPIGTFRRKTDQKDNAIGYQKCAMVFHMLRREIGEQAFWNGVRRLVAEYRGVSATWLDLEQVFQGAAGRDLRWFFAQWIERKGAPTLTVPEAESGHGGSGYWVVARITQQGQPFRVRLEVVVELEGGHVHRASLDLTRPEEMLTVQVPSRPLALRVDPDFETFRRLDRDQVPPMLNLFVTDRNQVVVLSEKGTEEDRAPYQQVADRLAGQEALSGNPPAIVRVGDNSAALLEGSWQGQGSVLILGGPSVNPAALWAMQVCADRISVGGDRITIDGRIYEGPGLALLVSCPHPDRPGSVVTLFFGWSSKATAPVARLLFFYGWHSYLVFRDGAVVARGDFPPPHGELEVRFDAP